MEKLVILDPRASLDFQSTLAFAGPGATKTFDQAEMERRAESPTINCIRSNFTSQRGVIFFWSGFCCSAVIYANAIPNNAHRGS